MSSTNDAGVADTLPPEEPPGAPPSSGDPPVASWDRYELLELLGKGGMGSVYKARDRLLDRTVAIKFILGADPNLTMRFMREARAQARIEHPNVCRVYEVGEIKGRAYIVLQFVDGEPLHKVAARMSLDEKVAVVRDVAVAVQEAHRLGIVHRDLKPANVMVERTEDGRWSPVVMDFGLAREATIEAGLTETGVPLGTPAYMSPEQARGDVHAVDRRSDVYSLGATLYELLTGGPPFPATALAVVLAQVILDDPPAPRSVVPSLPVDLETIALKCLAKDPTHRYPSARALADDLGRYLEGEPILGRRLSVWQRLRLRARRHRALVILGAWSLAIIVAVSAFGVRAWIRERTERELTAERARLAEQLGREATEIEGSLREAYLWPLHDTRRDRQRVRQRMRAIAATDHNLGDFGRAIIHSALGRGHLALHEWQEANDELTRAAGAYAAARRQLPELQMPELHAARGRALGELYRRALEEVLRSVDKAGDGAWLARQQQELAQKYLVPARRELAQSRASGDDALLLEARIALYGRNFADAEKGALAVAERQPGSSEARKLAADAVYNAAIEAFDRGDYGTARPKLERATKLYAEASEIARSDASLYEAAAQAWLQHAEIDFRQGRSPGDSIERALDLIDHRALRADPDYAPAYTTKSYVLLRRYRTPLLADQDDPRALLDRMAQAATRAVEIDPRDANAWTTLGNAHVYRGTHELYSGGQAAPWLNRALDEFGTALAIQPNHLLATNGLGRAHRWLGTSLEETGRDPMPEYQAALDSYARAARIDPQYLSACANQAELLTSIAEYDDAIGTDPRPAVDRARSVAVRCLEIDPKFYVALDTLARAELALAHSLFETGGDPGEALARARAYLDRDEALHPGHTDLWHHRLVAAGIEAAFQLRHGADPTRSVTAGHAALDHTLRLMPASALSYVEAARLDLVAAAWAEHTGTGAAGLLTQALAEAEKAIALNPPLARAQLVAAEACLQIAKAQRSPAVVEKGITHVEQARKLNPRLRKAQAIHDELLRLRAR